MPKPDIAAIKREFTRFNVGPLAFSLAEAKALRQQIYHALYYDDQGWQKLSMSDHITLARMIPRIRGIEDCLE